MAYSLFLTIRSIVLPIRLASASLTLESDKGSQSTRGQWWVPEQARCHRAFSQCMQGVECEMKGAGDFRTTQTSTLRQQLENEPILTLCV